MTHVLRETVDLEGISLFANWEMGRKAKTYKFLCIKKGGGGMRKNMGWGQMWKEKHWWKDGPGVAGGQSI